MNVMEIYRSIQGEGTLMGIPTTFVRFFACNLRCSWCDTKYSWSVREGGTWESISPEEVVERVNALEKIQRARRLVLDRARTGIAGKPDLSGDLDRAQRVHEEGVQIVDHGVEVRPDRQIHQITPSVEPLHDLVELESDRGRLGTR